MINNTLDIQAELDKWAVRKYPDCPQLYTLTTEHPQLIAKTDQQYFTRSHGSDEERIAHLKTICANAYPFIKKKGIE